MSERTQRYYRTIATIEEAEENRVLLRIASYQDSKWWPRSELPDWANALAVGDHVFCKANTGAEDVGELSLRDFEEVPPLPRSHQCSGALDFTETGAVLLREDGAVSQQVTFWLMLWFGRGAKIKITAELLDED